MANWAALQEKLIDRPVFKRAKHGIHFKQADGSILANFSGKPCHYFDGKLWKPIDTKLIAIGTEYGAPGLKPRIKTDGTVRIDGTEYNQRSTRIGIFDPTTRSFTAIKTIPLGSLDGDKLIAESGIWKRELRLTEDGLREEIVIASKPTNTGADLNDWLVLETQVTGVTFPDGWLSDFKVSEFQFPTPSAHDAEGHEADCKRYARTVDGKQFIYTGVPATWLVDAVYPVVIDPDFAGGTEDGHIIGNNATYSTARSTSTGIQTTNIYLNLGQNTGFYVWRQYFLFDTSSIGSGSTVTQVNLKLTWRDKYAVGGDFDMQIVKQDWSEWAADQSDATKRETAYDGCLSGTADDNILGNTSTHSGRYGAWTSGNLSTAWVSKTGTTYYSLRSAEDYNNSEPSGTEYVEICMANITTESYRPVLTVTYSAAAGNPHYYYRQL